MHLIQILHPDIITAIYTAPRPIFKSLVAYLLIRKFILQSKGHNGGSLLNGKIARQIKLKGVPLQLLRNRLYIGYLALVLEMEWGCRRFRG